MGGHHGPVNTKVNTDFAAYDATFSQGRFYRFLHRFPAQHRVKVGTTCVIAAAVAIYAIAMPSKNTRPVKTLSPQWKAATKEYEKTQATYGIVGKQ